MTDVEQLEFPECESCGYVFDQPESVRSCPKCGSVARVVARVRSTAVVWACASMKAKQPRAGYPGPVKSTKNRSKSSRHGIPAREEQIYDRSDPNETVKYHHVEEQQPDGSWETVHEETEVFEAKRRP